MLLAKTAAVSLDYREANTRIERTGARIEAAELAEMTNYEFTAYGTPPTDFFEAHDKPALLKHLETMGVDDPVAGTLKKAQLAVYVAEQAAEREWAPPALSWRMTQDITPDHPTSNEGATSERGVETNTPAVAA
jgi:ParB family chromosome partitioning protein